MEDDNSWLTAILFARMHTNVQEAEFIYNISKRLGLFNSQEFMDWQDNLNKYTFVDKKDLE